MVSVNGTAIVGQRIMRKYVVALFALLVNLPSSHAQEVMFDRVSLPTRENESVYQVNLLEQRAGGKQLATVYYAINDTPVRDAIVSIEGKVSEVLLEPFAEHTPQNGTTWRFITRNVIQYKDKVVIVLRDEFYGTDTVWVTDGTRAGTRKLSEEHVGLFYSNSMYPFIIKDSLVLLWSDGTVKLLDLATGAIAQIAGPAASPWPQAQLGYLADGRGYFRSSSNVYVSDGTAAGTQVISTITDSHYSGSLVEELDQNDPTPIRVSSTGPGPLLITDGTVAGTRQVPIDSVSGMQLGKKLIYTPTTPEYGQEPWVLDLVTLESSLLKDIAPGATSGVTQSTQYMSRVNNKIFFIANDGSTGRELWVTDGTAAGTKLVKDIVPGPEGSLADQPLDPFTFGNKIVFRTSLSQRQSVWISDGTSDGTYEIVNFQYITGLIAPYIESAGLLGFLSVEQYGVSLDPLETKWDSGLFLRFLDPSLGPPTSAFLVIDSQTQQPLGRSGGLSTIAKAGDYYYVTSLIGKENGMPNQIFVAQRNLCGTSDFKPMPGQCGCNIEELPADSTGAIAQSNAESDGSAVCLTPIGPIFVPASVSGDISGKLSQGGRRPDSLQLTIPASMINALQTVVTAPNVDVMAVGEPKESITTKARAIKPTHAVGLVVLDKGNKTVRKLPLRRTNKGTLTVKLGRRLTAKQTVAFQYAVGVDRNGTSVLQTPYKKRGRVKMTKSRR